MTPHVAGIIPTKAEKMASICFDLMTTRLFNIREIFSRVDPAKFAEVMDDAVLLMMDQIVNEVAEEYMPDVWKKIPQKVKDDIVVTADNESTEFMTAFMKDMQVHIDDIVHFNGGKEILEVLQFQSFLWKADDIFLEGCDSRAPVFKVSKVHEVDLHVRQSYKHGFKNRGIGL